MPAHGCVSCPENLGCCICNEHDHTRLNYELVLTRTEELEEEMAGSSREIFAAAAALLMNDVDDSYLSSLAEAQDSFRLVRDILRQPEQVVQAELYPQGETMYARIQDEEYMLVPTRLLAERLPQDDDEEAVLATLWDLLAEDA